MLKRGRGSSSGTSWEGKTSWRRLLGKRNPQQMPPGSFFSPQTPSSTSSSWGPFSGPQAIFFCFHLDWEDQVSKERIISRLLWRLHLYFSHFTVIYSSAHPTLTPYTHYIINAILLSAKDASFGFVA